MNIPNKFKEWLITSYSWVNDWPVKEADNYCSACRKEIALYTEKINLYTDLQLGNYYKFQYHVWCIKERYLETLKNKPE